MGDSITRMPGLQKLRKGLNIAAFIACAALPPAFAGAAVDAAPQSEPVADPSQDDINALMAQIRAHPNNLDNYFRYAKLAEALGEYEKALRAYETMLLKNPGLDRIRLDLGIAYLKSNRPNDARTMLNQVLARNPPPQVRENIERALKEIDDQSAHHNTSGFVQVGFTVDSNATSAPGSGSVTVIDTNIALDPSARGKKDQGLAFTAGVQHSYRFNPLSKNSRWSWDSSLVGYQTLQNDQDQLNLQLVSLRSGPSVSLPEARTKLSLTPNATVITLDREHYLDIFGIEAKAEAQLSQRFMLEPAIAYEWREFHNSPTVTVYDDRTGGAWQASLTGRYLITARDMVDVSAQWRDEDTQERYYNNHQWQMGLGYAHLFEKGYFASLRGSYRRSFYDRPDLLISARTRNDTEATGQFTLGKNFENDFTASIGYMYRDVDSNIQNYAYDNHRVTGNVGLRY